MNMENACYYTFSTVSQTLAGAFGFLVAVVLYQLQGLRTEVLGTFKTAIGRRTFPTIEKKQEITDAILSEDHIRACNILDETPLNAGVSTEIEMGDKQGREILRVMTLKMVEIRRRMRTALRLTGITIGLSLVLLTITPAIKCVDWLAGLCLMADVTLACLCIWMYYPLVYSVTE
jgi:hypothetical protein